MVADPLNLAYPETGWLNGIKLFYLGDLAVLCCISTWPSEVADSLELPTERISKEMLVCGFHHFTVASYRGNNQSLVEYFCHPKNQDIGIVKAWRKAKGFQELDLSPFPSSEVVTNGRILGTRESTESTGRVGIAHGLNPPMVGIAHGLNPRVVGIAHPTINPNLLLIPIKLHLQIFL